MPMQLTASEKLAISRRRENKTQLQKAQEYGIHFDTYGNWERDLVINIPDVELSYPLQTHEVCYILRRRSGKTQQQVAKELNMSRVSVNLMEKGKISVLSLASYWGA